MWVPTVSSHSLKWIHMENQKIFDSDWNTLNARDVAILLWEVFCGWETILTKVFLVIVPNQYLILLHCVYRFHICNHIRHIFQGFFISNHLFLVLVLKRLQLMLLNPLKELSNVLHADIRQKQLESVLQILQSQGDSLGPGWPLVLGVIGAIRNDQG